MLRYFRIIVVLVFVTRREGKVISVNRNEPSCYSRFDWEDKLLEKTIATDFKMDQQVARVENLRTELKTDKEVLRNWKEQLETNFEMLKNIVDAKFKELREKINQENDRTERLMEDASMFKLTTYTRWGRTVCPGNGSEPVYDGYAGGSWFDHKGGASSMLCLPKEPEWDSSKFNDKTDTYVGLVFGSEYQDGPERSAEMFGKSHSDQDVPCVVCEVRKRSSILMIPGRIKCYDGWTFEYSGHLMSGHYDHNGGTDYYCVDKDPENVSRGHDNHNGHLLYFVETRCGSLSCPPYVDGRELHCVVCSK